jgi:diguanylate cyclase (GGDEF)-like protein
VFQAHLKSRVSRRLFIRFLLAAMLPMVGMALFTYQHVSQLLLDNEFKRLKQESKAYGMSLIDGLDSHGRQLKHYARHATQQTAANGLEGFTSLTRFPDDAIPDLTQADRHHLAQGKPLIRLVRAKPGLLLLQDADGQLIGGAIADQNLWKNDTAPENYCVIGTDKKPLFCSPGLSPPEQASWPPLQSNVNAGVFPWRVDDTDYLGAYWQARLTAVYNHPGFIILVVSRKSDALADLAYFRLIFPAIVILALALAAWLANNQIRRQMRPLERLNEGTRRLAAGDFDVVIPELGEDEFGNLAQAFNHMSGNLRYKFYMLNMLAELDRAILNASEMDYVVQAVLGHMHQAIPCDSVGILRLDEDGKGILLTGKNAPDGQSGEICKASLLPSEMLDVNLNRPWLAVDISRHEPGCFAKLSTKPLTLAYLFRVSVNGRLDSILLLGFIHQPQDQDEIVKAGISLADRLAVAASNMAWEEKLYHQAHFDALTDLPNRVLLRDRIEQAMLRAQRENTSVCAMLIDLDNFKQVNDTLGHSVGDALLIECAHRLVSMSRRSDTVARLGGDEFLFLIPDLAVADGERTAMEIAQKIVASLAMPVAISDHPLTLKGSIGIAFYPDNANSFEDLLKMADAAMYEAKRRKTGSFSFYSEKMNEVVRARFELTQELREAIENGELLLHYQPKVAVANHRIVGAEALIRWNSPKRGLVSPAHFLPVLNEMGLGDWLGKWVLNTACAQAMAWQSQGLRPILISVNVSPANFMNGSIIHLVKDALASSGLSPEHLELEILEETAITSFEEVHAILTQLREMSVHIALDDFGTGYTSLVYLSQIPANILKIDRAFISNLLSNPRQKTLLMHIIAMAKVLGYSIVAEGVEELSQLEMLNDMQCDIIQGYLFSKPLTADEFAKCLRQEYLEPGGV